ETAKYRVDLDTVQRWLDVTDADEATRDRVLALAREAATEVAEYRSIFRGSLFNAQQALIQQEAAAGRLRHFQPYQIPGPFHTTEFRDPAESTIVQVELPAVEMTFTGADDLAAFETAWQRMVDAALDPQESRQFLAGLLRSSVSRPARRSG